MSSSELLAVRNLGRRFEGLLAVDDLSFAVHQGEIVSLIGPNGAGKTTVFNVITGIHAPSSGTITYASQNLAGLGPHQICQRGIARTFQNLRIFLNLTVLENVMVGLTLSNRAGLLSAVLRTPGQRREEARLRAEAEELLELLGLGAVRDQLARYLPHGELRQIEIARALATKPTLLMLDEPAGGMSHAEIEGLKRLILRLRDELGKTVLLVEHHMSVVMDISDRVVVLNYGRKIAEGTPGEVKRDPQVVGAYLGSGTLV